MNRRRLLLLGAVGLLLVCACAATLLFVIPEQDNSQTAERVVESNESVADEQPTEAVITDKTEASSNDTQSEAETPIPTNEPTEQPTPTDKPTPTIEPTDTPVPVPGISRVSPYPLDTLVEAPNWNIQVLEVIRGEDAWQLLQTTNQFNDPPQEGMEYLLIRLKAVSTYTDSESHTISGSDFGVTGDRYQRYRTASVVAPEPELSAELFSGGETEGWIPFAVGQDETSLMLIVDELLNFDDDRFRYIALEEGASLTVDPSLFGIDPSTEGLSRSEPVPLGETAITEDWEVTVLEVIRGGEAWSAVQAANQFNEPPNEGMEYVATKILVRYIGTDDNAVNINGSEFDLTGEANILYDWPSIVDPEPSLDVYLYPGGEFEGWTVMEAREGEGNLMVQFEPSFEFSDDNVRYLALSPEASVSVPPELSEIERNDLGESRASPAPLGQTVVGENWEFTILEVIRGNDALIMAQEANQFNEPPDPGMEYVAVKVRARNISTEDEPEDISGGFFSLVDETNVEYDLPSIVDPYPSFDISLFPGGSYEAWVIMQASEGSNDLIAVISPSFEFETYYMALEP